MTAPGVKTYLKQPVAVEAIQWTGKNPYAVRAFTGMHTPHHGIGNHFVFTTQAGCGELYVAANHTWVPVEIGEWIIQDSRGFYPCKADVFAETYREAP